MSQCRSNGGRCHHRPCKPTHHPQGVAIINITASRYRHYSWVLLGRGRLSLPAVALPLSPSLASPPPSLRSGTSPQGDFICLVGVVRAAIPAPPAAQPTYRHARKEVRSFFVRCGLSPPPCVQRTSDRKKWGPPPHFYFLSDNRFTLSLRGV